MELKKNSDPFSFHESIDSETLSSLYDNDLAWIEEIFSTVLENYDSDSTHIRLSLESGDLESLRKAVHKMKPSYGFIGMLKLQEKCLQLETKCKASSSVDDVRQETENLIKDIAAAKNIVQQDYQRLKTYNQQAS